MVEWIDGGNGERLAVMGDDGNYKSLAVRQAEPAKVGGYRCYVNGQLLARFKTRRTAMRHAEDIAAAQLAEIT